MSAMLWSDIIYAFSHKVNAVSTGGLPFVYACHVRHDWLITVSFSYACVAGGLRRYERSPLGVKFATAAAVLKSNLLLPGKGRVSNTRGMPGGGCWGYKSDPRYIIEMVDSDVALLPYYSRTLLLS